MYWAGIEGPWKQQKGETMLNLGDFKNAQPVTIAGRNHEQLVEALQEKYSIAPKGKPLNFLEKKLRNQSNRCRVISGRLYYLVMLKN
jgi:hypothetical protein